MPIIIHSCCIITAHGVWRIEDGSKHILLDVADFCCIATHTLNDVLNVYAVNICISFSDIGHTMRTTCNGYLFFFGA